MRENPSQVKICKISAALADIVGTGRANPRDTSATLFYSVFMHSWN